MVSISSRMHKLQTRLLAIRLGSGAMVLPKEVKRIDLRFAPKINGGHMGARKFWRHELVRLKYHNPTVAMSVDRSVGQTDPAVMSIHFASDDATQTSDNATSSAVPIATERVETINMKNYTNSEILDALVRITKAYPIEPTAQDTEMLEKLEEKRIQSDIDRKISMQKRDREKREKELLEQARGEIAAQAA